MIRIRCEQVAEGVRTDAVMVVLRDYFNRRHFMRLKRRLVLQERGLYYIPGAVVYVDEEHAAAQVQLPDQTETRANRLWFALSDLSQFPASPKSPRQVRAA